MRLRKKNQREKAEESYEEFKALIDLYKHSLSNDNINVVREIWAFLSDKFQTYREGFVSEEVVYEDAMYTATYEMAQHITELNNSRVKAKAWNINSASLLFGDYDRPELSEKTFSVIWEILKMLLHNEQDDMLVNYWGSAHQYVGYQLKEIHQERGEEEEIINEHQVNSRENARKQFLQFHVALGGLTVYLKRPELLIRFLSYTQSQPPRYDLLPDTMEEVFEYFIVFQNRNGYRLLDIEFPFPNLDGLSSTGKISTWITRYVAVLFLRQYSLSGYLTHYYDTTGIPKLPETQSGKKLWIDSIDWLQAQVAWVLDNHNLLDSLNLRFITQQWCRQNGKLYPSDFFAELRQRLNEAYELDEVNQPISEEKRALFENSVREIVSNEISVLENCFSQDNKHEDSIEYFKSGRWMLWDKAPFADKQASDHANFDSYLATQLVSDYRSFVAEIYLLNTSVTYRLPISDIDKGIERLNLDPAKHLILNFKTYLGKELELKDGSRFSKRKYKGIDMIQVKAGYHQVERSMFVLEKDEMPSIHFLDINEDDENKLELNVLNEDYKLYASLVDLRISHELRNEFIGRYDEGELKKSVLSNISFNHQVKFKKGAKVIRIKAYTPFEEEGLIGSTDEIRPF